MSQHGATALVLGLLVTVIPLSFVLRLLHQLPRALVLSHPRWPLGVNCILAGAVTASSTWFFAYASGGNVQARTLAFRFLIAAAAYAFGLVLMLRQFCGAYDEFFITVGATGLTLRKTSYSNIVKVDARDQAGETHLLVTTAQDRTVRLVLPTPQLERFYSHVRKKRSGE